MMFLLLLINKIIINKMFFFPVLCSNCVQGDVHWVLETYYVYYDNHGHVDELVFLLITSKGTT